MAKGGGFESFLNLYSKIVWAVVGTLLAVGIMCAAAHMHGACGKACLKGGCSHAQKK